MVVGLLGVRRRQNAELDGYLQCIDEGEWQDCPVGITSRAKKNKPPRTRVQEVAATPTPEDAATKHRIPRRHHGHRYFDWALRDGVFHFFDHPVNLEREKRLEGKYVVMTSWTKQSGAA